MIKNSILFDGNSLDPDDALCLEFLCSLAGNPSLANENPEVLARRARMMVSAFAQNCLSEFKDEEAAAMREAILVQNEIRHGY